MKQQIAHIALIVSDYDEAIMFYTEKLGFKVIRDIALNKKRDGFYWLQRVQRNLACYLLKLRVMNKLPGSAIRQVGGFSYFFIQIIFGETIKICWLKEFHLRGNLLLKVMEQ